jgi:WD40 repeat protein
MLRSTLALLLFASMLLLSGPAGAQKTKTKEKDKAGPGIKADPLTYKPGDPISARSLVTQPTVVKGVVTWSLETRRHRGNFSVGALSPDGKLYATGGLDGTIRIWETDSGKLAKLLMGHNSYVYGLAFSPDGQTLASGGSFDATVRLWDVKSGMPLKILKGHPSYVVQVAWSPDGRTVVGAGGESGVVLGWDAGTGKEAGKIEFGRPVRAISWHPEGKSVAVAAQTMPVQIWNPDTFKLIKTLGDIKSDVYSVAWSPDGKTLAAGMADSTLLFDEEGKEIRKLEGRGHAVAWTSDNKQLATSVTTVPAIKIWNAEDGKTLQTIPATAYTLVYEPKDKQLISIDYTNIQVWDAGSGKSYASYAIAGTVPPVWFAGRPLVTGVGTGQLSLWDQATGKLLRTLEGHTSTIMGFAWSPDGKQIATACYDKFVRVFESATGNLLQKLEGHTGPVTCAGWAHDGTMLGSGGYDKAVIVWSAKDGQLLHTLKGHTEIVNCVAWAPGSSEMLASGSVDKTIRIWNGKSGQFSKSFSEGGIVAGQVFCLAWSPDGKMIVSGQADHRARLWQVSSGKLVTTFENAGSPPQVSSLAWSPNDQVLASGRGNHTLQLWNPKLKTDQLIHSFATMAPVQQVAWTPGSNTIVSANADRTTRFFDAVAGQLRGVLLAEEKQIIAVSHDGNYRAEAAASELIVVAQLDKNQETMTPAAFATKFKWKNVPANVKLTGK